MNDESGSRAVFTLFTNYLFSKQGEAVESIRSTGTNRQMLLNNGLGVPEDIVVDDVSRNFYFSDSKLGRTYQCDHMYQIFVQG